MLTLAVSKLLWYLLWGFYMAMAIPEIHSEGCL
jgi:hypothetical protein